MPKNLIKRFMPDPQKVRNHKHLKIFGKLLHDANLWHMNRRSVAGAFAVGLFFAWVPVPFQMVLAAAGAIIFRTNLPISVGLVWLTNPVTMPPLFYGAYLFGAMILGHSGGKFNFEPSFDWLLHGLDTVWMPFLLGCLLLGILSSVTGYITIRLLWRLHVVRLWEAKKNARKLRLN